MPKDTDEDFQDYLDDMVELAIISGATEATAKDEMLKVLEFQQSLVNNVSLKWTFTCFSS